MDVNVPDTPPTQIRYTGDKKTPWLTPGKVYEVTTWDHYGPRIINDAGTRGVLTGYLWEPVGHGPSDPADPTPDLPPRKEVDGVVAHSILTEAAGIVVGDRHTTHGQKERSFQVIADFWNAYIQGRREPNDPLTPRDVSQLMVLLKIARSIQGQAVRDHFVDQCGYAAIAGELG